MGKAIVISDLSFADTSVNIGHVTLLQRVKITGITLSASAARKNKIQMSAAFTPPNTNETELVWSITSGDIYASVDQQGVVTILPGADNSNITVRASSAIRSAIYGEITIPVTYTVPSPIDEIDTSDLVFAYNLAKYSDGYTGTVEDDSGNNVPITLVGAEQYDSIPIFGFREHSWCVNSYGAYSRSNIKITFPQIETEGAMTIELYVHLRTKLGWDSATKEETIVQSSADASATAQSGGSQITGISDNNMRIWLSPYKIWYIGPTNNPNSGDTALAQPITIQGFNGTGFTTDYTHIVISTSPAAVNIYFDGKQVLTTNNTSKIYSQKELSFFTGAKVFGDVKWFAAYNRTLDANEVAANLIAMHNAYPGTFSEQG